MSKIKIFNDPVYGFITIPRDIIFQLIDHPYFQRLRYIKQLGLTSLVYPGALHTRFHHALGALHLMHMAIDNLRGKGVEITDDEYVGACIAILLHDIGHGPFSHALEQILVKEVHHEDISLMFMNRLNEEFGGRLTLAIDIFTGRHPKKFLHQLVSSQLDTDRLDYLRRDSFYTGVSEGSIGSDRIIMMMDVRDMELVIEDKGIYSIEKFLMARSFMYWQVYLHKTVISAEQLIVKILQRAQYLSLQGNKLFATDAFAFFLIEKINKTLFSANPKVLDTFARLDDVDVLASIKNWVTHSDIILSALCKKMINRDLFRIELLKEPPAPDKIAYLKEKAAVHYGISSDDASYFVFSDMVENRMYTTDTNVNIKILLKDNSVKDLAEVSDQFDVTGVNRSITKYFLCYPKELAN
jgi:HD superfamily phosphohydrolase